MPKQKVELYGMARVLTGSPHVDVQVQDGSSVRDVLRALGRQHPILVGVVLSADCSSLSAGYAANLNGLVFLSEPEATLREDDVLLLVPSAAGGATPDENAARE